MSEWSCDVTVTVHDTEIELIVKGIPEGPDYSVGMGVGLEDPGLYWQDETPVEEAFLAIIGPEAEQKAYDDANQKLADEGPPEPDPDYQRDMREDL